MKKTRYYIKPPQAFGRKLPVASMIAIWLFSDRLQAPQWWFGIYWFICLILLAIFLYDCHTIVEKPVDIQELLKRMNEVQENKTAK